MFILNPYIFGGSPLLLDTYQNAIGAYSLRKLRTAYTGYAIRVVRGGDLATLDVGFNINGTLDTSSLTSFIGGQDGSISIWYDQSGNGNNATQATFGRQPQIIIGGTLQLVNGNPIIRNANANTQRFLTTPISNIQNRPISIITASKINQLATNAFGNVSFYIGGTVGGNGGGSRYEMVADNTSFMANIRGTSTLLVQSSFNTNAFIQQAHFSLTTLTSRFNGVDTSMAINDSGQFSTASNFVLIGAPSTDSGFCANIGMFETIFYLNDKTGDRAGIEANINQYYSIY